MTTLTFDPPLSGIRSIEDVQPHTDAAYASNRSDKSLTAGIQPGESIEAVVDTPVETFPGSGQYEQERYHFTAPSEPGQHTVKIGDQTETFTVSPMEESEEHEISGYKDRQVDTETNTPDDPMAAADAEDGSGPGGHDDGPEPTPGIFERKVLANRDAEGEGVPVVLIVVLALAVIAWRYY